MRPSTPGLLSLTVLFLMGGLLFLAGCAETGSSSGADEAAGAIVRDSAGVTVVENRGLDEQPAVSWTLGASPSVDIGALDGPEEYQLFRVRDAARLPDGRLAIVNSGTSELRLYAPDGTHLDSWGREGEGPGEFVSPWTVLKWPADSVAVWDNRVRRITVFAGDGALGRSVTLPSVDGIDFPNLNDVTEDGNLLLQGSLFNEEEPRTGYVRVPMHLTLVSPEGVVLGDLGRHPGDEAYMHVGDGTIEIFRLPFTRNTLVAPAGDEVLISPTDRFELRFYAGDGNLSRVARVAEPVRLVTEADRAAELERRLEGAPEQVRPGIRTLFEETPMLDTFPAFSEVVPDVYGHQWMHVFRSPADGGPERWLVMDETGASVGTIELPEGLVVFEIGEDFVLGLSTDELGVEHVQLWPLDRSGAP